MRKSFIVSPQLMDYLRDEYCMIDINDIIDYVEGKEMEKEKYSIIDNLIKRSLMIEEATEMTRKREEKEAKEANRLMRGKRREVAIDW